MRALRTFRALVALLACVACLASPVVLSGALASAEDHGGAHELARWTPADAGHDACWTAEAKEHDRHDDHRFESQQSLRHHLHAAVAWSGAAFLAPPGPAVQSALPRPGESLAADALYAHGELDRSPRQSRAPPRA